MSKPIAEQVIVIVGASSGIGLQTALSAAKQGARLVIAARSAETLEQVAAQIRLLGAEVQVFPLDISVWEQAQRLADTAFAAYGRIDTWVNAAATSVYGRVEATTPDEYERILHVNVLGTIFASKAVLPYFQQQGYGTLINISSVLGHRAIPLQSGYVASKFAVRGFTDALRMELQADHPGINVTLILPASINTPFFSHARTHFGAMARPVPPVYDPELVADAILHAARYPRRDVFVGGAAWNFSLMERLFPGTTDKLMMIGKWAEQAQISDKPAPERDALFDTLNPAPLVHGDFGHLTKPSVYTRLVELFPGKGLLALPLAAGVLIALLVRGRD